MTCHCIERNVYGPTKTMSRWTGGLHKDTLCHTFHHILTVRHSVLSGHSSSEQRPVLSVPERGALDIDSSQNRCGGVCKWGHVVDGSGRTAQWSDDNSHGGRDISRIFVSEILAATCTKQQKTTTPIVTKDKEISWENLFWMKTISASD